MVIPSGTAERQALASRRFRFWQWCWPRFPEILFVVFTTASGLWAGGRWMDPVGDPGFSWSLGYRLSHGERLYRDVYVAYGPLSPYLLALWARLIGTSSLSILFLNWTPAILAGLLLLRCMRRFLSPLERIALAGMILATSVFVPGAGRLVLPYYSGVVHAFVFALAALLLIEPVRPLRGAALLAGAFAGLAFACKQEIGLATLVALLSGSLAGIKRPVRWAAEVLAGFAAVALAAAAFALSSAPLDWLRNRDHLWPLNPRPPSGFDVLFRSVAGLSDPKWFASLRASAWRLLVGVGLLAALGGLLARERSREAWRRSALLGAGLGIWWAIERFPIGVSPTPVRLSVLVSFLVCILAWVSPGLEGRRVFVALGFFAGLAGMRTVFSRFMTGPYDGPSHFAAAASWIILLLVFAPRLLWPGPSSRAAALMRAALAGVLCVSFWWNAAGGAAALRFPSKMSVSTPGGRVYLEFGQANLLREVGRYVAAGDRILVLPETNAVDALYAARSVSPLLHHFPGLLDGGMEADLLDRFNRDPPSIVVLFNRATSEFQAEPFGKGFGVAIWQWCVQNYRVVYASPRGKILRLRDDWRRSESDIRSRSQR